jgi:hypothetical protein
MEYKKDKTKLIALRLSPLEMAKLDAQAKDAGLSRSEMLRRILTLYVSHRIPIVGKVSGADARVTLTLDDGEVMPIQEREE